MEKFFNLNTEKQNEIINAAISCFAESGYKKTAVSEIARRADIAKSMVFHYFGNKKQLYLYLMDFAYNILNKDVRVKYNELNRDFFDRVIQVQYEKLRIAKHYPLMFEFMKSAHYETDPEVRPEIDKIYKQASDGGTAAFLNQIDISKFKENVDVHKVIQLIFWCAEGYMKDYPDKEHMDLDLATEEFVEYLMLMKQNFYKEEYL